MTDIIKAYDHDYNEDHKKILDFIRENSPLDMPNALVNQIFENAFQLTAYERYGCITETNLFQSKRRLYIYL